MLAVDLRYIDPGLNGDVKTQTQDDKDGVIWTSDQRRLKRAQQVYIVESAINCLSIETADPFSCAIALRGLGNVDKAFQFRDIRPKAASEIDLTHASKLLGHTDKQITKTVYQRIGETVLPTK